MPRLAAAGNLHQIPPRSLSIELTMAGLVQCGLLGQGTFGIVVKALDLRSSPPPEVAIKLLPRGDIVSSFSLLSLPSSSSVAVLPRRRLECDWTSLQVKSYKTYVKREIENQSRLRHPLIITIKEVRSHCPQNICLWRSCTVAAAFLSSWQAKAAV